MPPPGPPVTFADLPEALTWLDAHVDFESAMPTRRTLPSLDRMRALAALLGDPHTAYPVIHITGTNGKGSTAAMVTSLVAAMGLTVGTYTSPNLSRVNERIARNGEPIDDEAFTDVLDSLARIEGLMDESPTRFELLTAAALTWFADEAVDVAVVEVGLGGTWDCTNIVHAAVSVVTNISYDHTEVLGPTLEDIARDKAGIFTSGGTAVVGETDPTLVALFRSAAVAAGSQEFWVRGIDFACTSNRLAVGGRLVDLRTPQAAYGELSIPLHGSHQGDNAACALAAAEAFFGSPLPEDVVAEGLGSVRVPGRLEVIGRHPLVLVDGAHNVAGMMVLARSLSEEFAIDGETTAVVGMLTGRDPTAMLDALVSAGVRSVIVCAPDSPRAMPIGDVAAAAASLGMGVALAATPDEAVRRAVERSGADDRVVVCGSLYVVADARAALLPGN
jgi:dihydrofolate synthase/folylpolyglutamate synthase